MKKGYLFIVLSISVVVIFYFFGNNNSSLKNFPPKNATIVAFGDSLVKGYGATPGNDFVSILGKKLNKPIINLGFSGNTSAEGLSRINDVLVRNSGTVIVLFGGNDYIRNISMEETFGNLRQIISVLQSNGAFVILLGVQGGLFNDSYQASFEKLSKEMGVLYVPNVLAGLFGDTRYMSEIVHPNDVGYAKIAEKVYSVIGKYYW